MGAELADGRPDFKASGREWRTAPLWGVGLLQDASTATATCCTTGARATSPRRSCGTAARRRSAREAFRAMPKADREALVKFVESL